MKSQKLTVAGWLKKWDSGEPVWSVEMGGLGPGYEQAIQIIAAEMMRSLSAQCKDFNDFDEYYYYDDERAYIWAAVERSENVMDVVSKLGPSGAQYAAAKNLASVFFAKTPWVAMQDNAVKDRKILVSKSFPIG